MPSSHKDLSPEQQHRLIIIESRKLASTGKPDVQAALQRFRQLRNTLSQDATPPKGAMPPNNNIFPVRWLRPTAIATAALLFVAGAALLWATHHATKPMPSEWLVATAGASGRTVILPDGSIVRLSADASMTYPGQFLRQPRRLRLTGNAWFTVAHDPANPFRVEVNNLTITVLGTSFGITTISTKTEIAVKEGLVEVSQHKQRVKVLPHEILTIPGDSGSWQKTTDTGIALQSPQSRTDTVITPASAHPALPKTDPPQTSAHPAKTRKLPTLDEKVAACNTMRAILDDLVKEHLVPNRAAINWAALSDADLIVNGDKQPDSLHEKFREKFVITPGEGYYYGHVQIVGRGYFFDKNDVDSCNFPAHAKKDSLVPPKKYLSPPKTKMNQPI